MNLTKYSEKILIFVIIYSVSLFIFNKLHLSHRLAILIHLVHERHPIGQAQFCRLLIGQFLQMLHQSPQVVAVPRDDARLPGLHSGNNRLLPERQSSLHAHFQTFVSGDLPDVFVVFMNDVVVRMVFLR